MCLEAWACTEREGGLKFHRWDSWPVLQARALISTDVWCEMLVPLHASRRPVPCLPMCCCSMQHCRQLEIPYVCSEQEETAALCILSHLHIPWSLQLGQTLPSLGGRITRPPSPRSLQPRRRAMAPSLWSCTSCSEPHYAYAACGTRRWAGSRSWPVLTLLACPLSVHPSLVLNL